MTTRDAHMSRSTPAQPARALRAPRQSAIGLPMGLGLCVLGWIVPLPIESAARAPEPPARLTIERSLLGKLQTLAAGLRLEIVLCLGGTHTGDGVHLTDFFMPDPEIAAGTRVLAAPCPSSTAAVWHNHPFLDAFHGPDGVRPRGEPIREARDLCALSRSDIQTTIERGYPFVVVSVDAETWCWWTLDQVKRFGSERLPLGPPISGQVSWRSPLASLP